MDSKKLKAVLSTIAGIILILILLFNSGLFFNKEENVIGDSGESITSEANVPTSDISGTDISDAPVSTSEPTITDIQNPTAESEASSSLTPTATKEPDATPTPTFTSTPTPTPTPTQYTEYRFRSKKLLNDHYEKHGIEMGFDSAESYEKAASDVINNSDALYKTEAEDGDHVYYVEETNEFAILSPDGYIRTYFLPSAGKAYFDRQ